ncbi:MAG TPA: nuclear transport factor 2 family protein [Candidatus Acidoferrum sp.]|nr:nuclear transport factor 2 family protein [Candidatus Acidoferrum sp.]
MATDPLTIIARWQAAVSAADFEGLRALSTDDIEIIGSLGPGRGIAFAEEWVRKTGIGLQTMRAFPQGGDLVVVEQAARWPAGADSAEAPERVIATLYTLRDNRVARAVRYEDLASALAAAGMSPVDR